MRLLAVLVAVLPLVTCLDTRMKHVSHSEPTSTPTSDLLFPTETNVCPGGPKSCNDDYQACKKFYRGRYVEFCRNLICGPVWGECSGCVICKGNANSPLSFEATELKKRDVTTAHNSFIHSNLDVNDGAIHPSTQDSWSPNHVFARDCRYCKRLFGVCVTLGGTPENCLQWNCKNHSKCRTCLSCGQGGKPCEVTESNDHPPATECKICDKYNADCLAKCGTISSPLCNANCKLMLCYAGPEMCGVGGSCQQDHCAKDKCAQCTSALSACLRECRGERDCYTRCDQHICRFGPLQCQVGGVCSEDVCYKF